MEENTRKNSTEKTENYTNVPESHSIDALLMEDDNALSNVESVEDNDSFQAVMQDLRSFISKEDPSLFEKKDEVIDVDESNILVTPPPYTRKTQKNKESFEQAKNNDDWDEDITLAPQNYVDAIDNNDQIVHDIPEDEPTPDFNLGENVAQSDDKFQLSINFTGEASKETVEEPEERKYDPEKPRIIDWIYDFAEMIVFVLLVVMILTAFVFKHAVVEGPSMNNTLEDGEHLIISNLFYTPARGDIIVFEDYSTVLKKPVVKRVIGLPGDTVEVKLDATGNVIVSVNGELLEENYAYNAKDSVTLTGTKTVVGEGEVFVMGDNRYHSTDSRDPGVGTIEIDSILGKVLFRFYPFDKFGTVE